MEKDGLQGPALLGCEHCPSRIDVAPSPGPSLARRTNPDPLIAGGPSQPADSGGFLVDGPRDFSDHTANKATWASAEIDDQHHVGSFDVNREQVLPEPSRFRREHSGLVVHPRDLRLNS